MKKQNANEFLKTCSRNVWRWHNKNSLCWTFYYVNDGKVVERGDVSFITSIL
jgi:hypothetical protein